jgi:hypothetical protein
MSLTRFEIGRACIEMRQDISQSKEREAIQHTGQGISNKAKRAGKSKLNTKY